MSNLKVIRINTILFFCGWTAILLAGADFPPPIGFLWLVLLTAILDFIQYKYLQKFLPHLLERKKNLFAKNLLFFTIGGAVVSVLCLAEQYKITFGMSIPDIITWIIVLTTVGAIYGVFFWFFNILLLKFFKM
ncbi:hypothetical protein [Desulforamulus aeronauticus]|uniref:Uncharacterized protein n=1 Tax=Desulforamulus aeronauticus DSM 10349 TaxID=1121421 RepID=A0A1M6S218_9FIRM|nr:hypothetical protein [Desulforamulus aeronauticus]SHK38755.1 hypothetical protein SAMN02745123_01683 [Desulforamulus aeronauticus DSM 10349]